MTAINAPSPALRVLVVDDCADTAESLAEVLSLSGFRARAAQGAEAALRAVAADPPDVILTDLAMPGMDGFELAHRIRERCGPKRPLLVAVTGCHGNAVGSAPNYFDLVVSKTADPAVIAGVLRRFERAIT